VFAKIGSGAPAEIARTGRDLMLNSPEYRSFRSMAEENESGSEITTVFPLDVILAIECLYSPECKTVGIDELVGKVMRLIGRGECRCCRGPQRLKICNIADPGGEEKSESSVRAIDFINGAFRVYGKIAARPAENASPENRSVLDPSDPLAHTECATLRDGWTIVPGVSLLVSNGETAFFPLEPFFTLGLGGAGSKYMLVGKIITWRAFRCCTEDGGEDKKYGPPISLAEAERIVGGPLFDIPRDPTDTEGEEEDEDKIIRQPPHKKLRVPPSKDDEEDTEPDFDFAKDSDREPKNCAAAAKEEKNATAWMRKRKYKNVVALDDDDFLRGDEK